MLGLLIYDDGRGKMSIPLISNLFILRITSMTISIWILSLDRPNLLM